MLYYVRRSGKWGYINASGELVVPLEADDCLCFSEGLGGTVFGNDLQVIDAKADAIGSCTNVFIPSPAGFSGGLLSVIDRRVGKMGYIDAHGSWVIPPGFSDARDFHNHAAIASDVARSKFGIIDRAGSWTCDPMYYRIFDFDEETSSTIAYECIAEAEGRLRCMLIDKKGHRVGDEFYDHGHGGGEGLIPVERDSKWGVVSQTGELVIPFAFDGINPFSNGMAAARGADGRLGVVDRCGHWVICPTFRWLDCFSEGLCAAAIDDPFGREKWGFINHDGDWVIEPKFGEAFEFRNGIARVHAPIEDEADKFGYIDKSGRFVWEPS